MKDKNNVLLSMALQLCTIMDDATRQKLFRCLKNKSDFSQETYAKQLDEEMNS